MPSSQPPILDLNSADADTLIRLLQISPRLAQRILAMRPFRHPADLDRVWGLDAETKSRLTDLAGLVPASARRPRLKQVESQPPPRPPSRPGLPPAPSEAHPKPDSGLLHTPTAPGLPAGSTGSEPAPALPESAPPADVGSSTAPVILPEDHAARRPPARKKTPRPDQSGTEPRQPREASIPPAPGVPTAAVGEPAPPAVQRGETVTPAGSPGVTPADAGRLAPPKQMRPAGRLKRLLPAVPVTPPAPAPAPRQRALISLRLRRKPVDWCPILILGVIFLIGAYLRFSGLNWDGKFHQHPDERFITMTAEKLLPVKGLGEYFDTASSTLNPLMHGSYTYGMLPLFIARGVGEILDMTHYDKIHLVGRALSGLFDLAAIFLLYLLGKRLFGRATGLLAAALAAAAVLPIQLSHYFAVDSYSTVFIVAAFLFAYRAIPLDREAETVGWPRLPYFGLFGLAVGMAMACKVNTAPVFGLIGIAGLAHLAVVWKRPPERKTALLVIAAGWALAGLGAAVAFRVFQPYAFNGPGFFGLSLNQRWLQVIKEVTGQVAGFSEWPPNHHWTERGFTYAWVNMVMWGLGLPLGLAAWAGWGWAGWRIWKGDWRRYLLLFVWIGAYFFWQNAQFWRYMRYFIPVYPFIILLGARALLELYDRTRPGRTRLLELIKAGSYQLAGLKQTWAGALASAALVVVVLGSYIYAFAFNRIYQEPITRVEASRWMMANIEAPVNVLASDADGQVTYPVAVQLRRSLNIGEQGRAAFKPTQSSYTSQIIMPNPSLAAADIHFWLRKGEKGGTTISEGHLILPAETFSGEKVIEMGEVGLEAGQVYNLRVVVYTSGPLSAGNALLRGNDDQAPATNFDLNLDLGEARYRDTSFVVRPSESHPVTRLVISGISAAPAAGETSIQVWLSTDREHHDVLGMASVRRDMLAPNGRDALVFSFPGTELSRGRTYYVTYKLLSGGPLVLNGDTFALETSWDDALPLPVDGYDPLGGMYDPLILELYDPDTPEKRERMANILDRSEYLVLPSNRAYDAMPRLPLRYPLSLRYYQALFNCVCTGDAMEARANSLDAGYISPLGFDLVASFDHPIDLGLFSISDLSADEAFTVYDHPKVMIFKKNGEYSPENTRAILGSVDLSQVIEQGPMTYTKMPTGLRLSAARLAAQKAGGTWSKLFDRQSPLNASQGLGVLAWYLLIAAVGWAAFPVLFAIFPGLADRGYPLGRLVGLLFLAWLAWLASSIRLASFTNLLLWACTLLLLAAGAFFTWHNRVGLSAYLRSHWRPILGMELLFAGLFLAGMLVRLGNPDIWHPWLGGEKPMDFAFFNAVLKAVHFPPEHPWYAGNYINYYYYGYVVAAVPTRLLGILPAVAFNLVLPTWFAMAGMGVYSAAANLVTARKAATQADASLEANMGISTRRRFRLQPATAAGLTAVALMLLLGNLYQVRQLVHYLPDVAAQPVDTGTAAGKLQAVLSGAGRVISGQAELPGDKGRWYFGPSRPILHEGPDTPIAEFPLFTFLFGDLHPHLLAMPALLAALGWILGSLFQLPGRRRWPETIAYWFLGGLIIGMLSPTHTWDYPSLLGLACASLVWHAWKQHPEWNRTNLVKILARPALLAALTVVLYMPFGRWFGTEYTSLEIWKGLRTPFGDYLTVHGIFLFVMLSYLVMLSAGKLREFYVLMRTAPVLTLLKRWVWRFLLLTAALLAASLLWFSDYQVLAFGLPLLAWLAVLLFRRGRSLEEVITLALFAAGLGVTLVVEVVVLKGDVGRSNMVFRYYNQAWIFFSLASAAALASLADLARPQSRVVRGLWRAGLAVLIAGGLIYPLTAVPLKMADRWPGIANPPHTLDGSAFMLGEAGQTLESLTQPAVYDDEGRPINLASDYAGIQYLQENAQGSPVIAEGQTTEYRWGSRYSIYTGLPAVVGWSWHVRQHNSILPGSLVENRIRELADFYNTTDTAAAADFLRHYNVTYVIVGDLERAYYSADGLAKFPQMVNEGQLVEAFSYSVGSSQLTIYQAGQ